MDISIIGAGNVGRALATSSVRAGHAVTISSSDREDAQLLAKEIGAQAAESNRAAAEAGEIVILAVPYDAVGGIVDQLGASLDGKVVVDLTNRFDPGNPGLVIDGTSNAEQIQARIPRAHVVKAFNTVLASRQADPFVDGIQLDGFVAADDEQAKAAVVDLVRSIGFRPVDAGQLTMARALEALGLLNISLNMRNGWTWENGWKLVGPSGA